MFDPKDTTFKVIVSLNDNPCSDFVVSLDFILFTVLDKFWSYFVVKEWFNPTPKSLKKRILDVVSIPTKSPWGDSATLFVDIPIKLSLIFATYSKSLSFNKNSSSPSFETFMPTPPFVLYINLSPVFKLWFLKYKDLVGTNTCVTPTPGLLKTNVVPIPTPEVVPTPTVSSGSK